MKRLQKFVLLCLLIFVSFHASTASAVTDSVVVSGLDRPWAVVAGPDRNIWISEKTGAIKVYTPSFKLVTKLTGFPDLAVYGEGGVLDIAFHPGFKNSSWVYVAYTVADPIGHHTRVNRFTYRAGRLQDHKIIFEGPSNNTQTHFGCRLAFDARGFLYASFGERRDMSKAQDMSVMNGKIVRLNDDGSTPRDNPFGSSSPIYTLGHRNPQGLAFHPKNGKLYESEHGPSVYDAPGGGDEINEIIGGTNYGWPAFHHRMKGSGVKEPLLEYTPAAAPSGIAFYTGSKIPSWTGDLFVATLRGQRLLHIRVAANGQLTEVPPLLEGKYGRLRDVETSPDGSLLVISETGKLIQLK